MSPRSGVVVDVSRYQVQRGDAIVPIDWAAARDVDGVRSAIVKVTEADDRMDPTTVVHVRSIREAGGIEVDAFHFFRSWASPRRQARTYVAALRALDLDLSAERVVAGDFERFDGMIGSPLADRVYAFLSEVGDLLGFGPWAYTSRGKWNAYVWPAPWASRFRLWVANYPVPEITRPAPSPPGSPALPRGWLRWDLWQYSKVGQVAGFPGAVDLSIWNPSPLAIVFRLRVHVGEGQRLRVRSAASIEAPIVGYLPDGAEVVGVEFAGDWIRIDQPIVGGALAGWISAAFVEVVE